jgi:hypothetical protein
VAEVVSPYAFKKQPVAAGSPGVLSEHLEQAELGRRQGNSFTATPYLVSFEVNLKVAGMDGPVAVVLAAPEYRGQPCGEQGRAYRSQQVVSGARFEVPDNFIRLAVIPEDEYRNRGNLFQHAKYFLGVFIQIEHQRIGPKRNQRPKRSGNITGTRSRLEPRLAEPQSQSPGLPWSFPNDQHAVHSSPRPRYSTTDVS